MLLREIWAEWLEKWKVNVFVEEASVCRGVCVRDSGVEASCALPMSSFDSVNGNRFGHVVVAQLIKGRLVIRWLTSALQ